MANRAFFQMLASLVERLTWVGGQFDVGSTGAVSAVKGSGVDNVVRVQQGVFQVKLSDSYNRLFQASVSVQEDYNTPATIASGLTSGHAYVITTVGDASAADWLAVGLQAGQVPAVGLAFVASSTGSGNATTARVAALAATATAEALVANVFGNPSLSVQNSVPGVSGTAKQAGYLFLTFRQGVDGALTDPPQNAKVRFDVLMRNSSVKGKGE